jgi:predicted CXXCH cytochrome family protein
LVDADSPNGNNFLLNDATPSDVCLGCHATGLGSVLGTDPLAPPPLKGAGNFVFLLEDNLNDGHSGASHPIPGDAAGHNLNAPGFGLAADATLTRAPGGFYPASVLGCTSCHDPHGNQNFRMLNGNAPVAAGLSVFFGSESDSNHTAYQSGMSEWCGTCHSNFHNNDTQFVHPTGNDDAIMYGKADVYNAYNGSDDITGGDSATAYLAAVPFEDPANTVGGTAGPTSGVSRVSCISCHRAHATSAPDAGRWDFSVTFLDEDGLESGSYAIPNPYTANQRSLCNKCHKKDVGDAPAS